MWGYSKFAAIDAIQNRAIRMFLGEHRLAPKQGIEGDFGWVLSAYRRQIEVA